MDSNSATSTPALSLPKSGGAIHGIGETFQPSLFTGTGNFSIPIAVSPGRADFGPKLTLQYSTGSGNGCFGLGWQLSVPRVSRKTEKGIPQYEGERYDGGAEDVFVLSGSEDLVVQSKPGTMEPDVSPRDGFTVTRYRPRTEGLFARIEKWMAPGGETHWRVTTKDNVTSLYGRTLEARVFDRNHPTHVFEWLLQETYDAKGNHILYEYAREGPAFGVDEIAEENRSYNQLYLRRIFYGNSGQPVGPARSGTHHRDGRLPFVRRYLFEIVFDYGDRPAASPAPAAGATASTPELTDAWPRRGDAFSTFRAGFEIRTLRLCERVLMFHHFRELRGATLVKSTDFTYDTDSATLVSFLAAVTVTSHQKEAGAHTSASLPPVSFSYSAFRPQEQRYQPVAFEGDDGPPFSLSNAEYTLIDLFGDGLPDLVHSGAAGLRYWRNLGHGRLDRPRFLESVPAGVTLSQPGVGFADFGGDGMSDLLVAAGPVRGFFEMTPHGGWTNFKHFEWFPSFELDDPDLRQLDLTGDGLTDVMVTRDHQFLWFRCRGEDGYDAPRAVPRLNDLNDFPDVYFRDPSGRVRLADMTGDGLSDIVLVHSGRIDYWPNLGYGRFGKRITMANSPLFDEGFDPKRLHLVDLDGSGCTDLVYVEFDRVHFWFNRSGNAWSERQTIAGTPLCSDLTAIRFCDFFGTGTTALLWSENFDARPGGSYRVLDFCGGVKPYLLTGMSNNMGAATRVTYAPSTKYLLEDRKNGESWATALPFPVHVVERVEVVDHVGRTKMVTTYGYRHGYFDGDAREFRGFGRVDQCDTEEFDTFAQSDAHLQDAPFVNAREPHHVPPTLTTSWFHTGALFEEGALLDRYRQEFYGGDAQAFTLGDHLVETGDAPRAANRALRGQLLRSEIYGLDDTPKRAVPYVVTETRYHVRLLQWGDATRPPVFLTVPQQTVGYHYERRPHDPRIGQQIAARVDDYGNVTDSIVIGYPRRTPLQPEQAQLRAVYTRTDFINAAADDAHYIGVPCQTRRYEITGLAWRSGDALLDRDAFAALLDDSPAMGRYQPYEWQRRPTWEGLEKRILAWTRSYFRKDAGAGVIDIQPAAPPTRSGANRLPLGTIDPLGLPYESYRAVFSDALLGDVFGDEPGTGQRRLPPELVAEAAYHREADVPGLWWIPSGQQAFDPARFYLAAAGADAFGAVSSTGHDDYALLAVSSTDPLANTSTIENDYRTLLPTALTDPNGNRTEMAIDTLGLVVGTALVGKGEGDDLATFAVNLPQQVADAHVTDPFRDPPGILKNATSRIIYDIGRYYRVKRQNGGVEHGEPNVVCALSRETHAHGPNAAGNRIRHSFVYFDGFGRPIQSKTEAEPDPGDPAGARRWVTSGWTIFNNKGKPVRTYEPFFSSDHRFRFDDPLNITGVSGILFYDPLGRAIAILHPNHTYEKIAFDSWRQETWDANDTIHPSFRFDPRRQDALPDPSFDPKDDPDLGAYFAALPAGEYRPTWYEQRIDPVQAAVRWSDAELRDAETRAARHAARHAATPSVAHLDTLGRAFKRIADNGIDSTGADESFSTLIELDIEGNTLGVTDSRGVVAVANRFDMAGRTLRSDSCDAGMRTTFLNAAGQAVYAWDANGNAAHTRYDALQRPMTVSVTPAGGAAYIAQQTIYGESAPSAASAPGEYAANADRNLRVRPYLVRDSAGEVTFERYDFKGNPEHVVRRLAAEYQHELDWTNPAAVSMEDEQYRASSRYDALNRVAETIVVVEQPTSTGAGHRYAWRPEYNEAGLLQSLDAELPEETRSIVDRIDYNAQGDRLHVRYGERMATTFTYEAETFRLQSAVTVGAGRVRQELAYSYDPVGHLAAVRDAAFTRVFNRNQEVDPVNRYRYDASYRLVEATGREHEAMGPCHDREVDKKQTEFIRLTAQPAGNGMALRNYTQTYEYDPAGNLTSISHLADGGGWTRSQAYASDSNRLRTSRAGCRGERLFIFPHDDNGNIGAMPHLPALRWDHLNRLREAETRIRTRGTRDRAFYTYDGSGNRVRKVVERGGTIDEERIYLAGLEIYRRHDAAGVSFERHTLHVMDGQRRVALAERRISDRLSTESGQPAIRYRYQLDNHLQSALLEADEDGRPISYEEFYPYGGTAYMAAKNRIEVNRKRYRYGGKERDDESGLYYFGARYYAPWLGRWTSADPAGNVDGVNLYCYAVNSPVAREDPAGTRSQPTNAKDKANHVYTQDGQDARHYLQSLEAELAEFDRETAEMGNVRGYLSYLKGRDNLRHVLQSNIDQYAQALARANEGDVIVAMPYAPPEWTPSPVTIRDAEKDSEGKIVRPGLEMTYNRYEPASRAQLQELGEWHRAAAGLQLMDGLQTVVAVAAGAATLRARGQLNATRPPEPPPRAQVATKPQPDEFMLIAPIMKFDGYYVTVIEFSSGKRQAVYQSSGRNSNMKGSWLPFDEAGYGGWMNKYAYTEKGGFYKGQPLYRLGSERMAYAAEAMKGQCLVENGIKNGTIMPVETGSELNSWLDAFGARRPPPKFAQNRGRP